MLAEGRPQFPGLPAINQFFPPLAFPSWFNNFFSNFGAVGGGVAGGESTGGFTSGGGVSTGGFTSGGGVSTGGFTNGGGYNFVSSGGSSSVSTNGGSSITSFQSNCVDGVCSQNSLLCTNGDCTQTKYKDDNVEWRPLSFLFSLSGFMV